MALNGTVLGDAISVAIQGQNPEVDGTQLANLKKYWEPIATAIVNHIQSNALVNVTVASVSGVLTGGGVSGPGTGTGQIT